MANPQYNKMMKQVQEMQRKMAQAQEELAVETVEASAGGGVVTVVVTGSLEVKEVRINPDAVDPEDVEMLQDLVVAATNEALRAAQDLASTKLGGATGGLDLPNIPGPLLTRRTPVRRRARPRPVCGRHLARLDCVYRTSSVRNAALGLVARPLWRRPRRIDAQVEYRAAEPSRNARGRVAASRPSE